MSCIQNKQGRVYSDDTVIDILDNKAKTKKVHNLTVTQFVAQVCINTTWTRFPPNITPVMCNNNLTTVHKQRTAQDSAYSKEAKFKARYS